jgi:hypothetical protein
MHVKATMYDNEEMTAGIGGNFVLPPIGNQKGICCWFVDLGTIDHSYEGHVTRKKMCMVAYELTETNHVFKDGEEPQPFIVHKELPYTMNEKAGLRKLVDSWRGEKLTNDQAKAFNHVKMLGVPGLVNIVHKESAKGKKRAEILTVTGLPEEMKAPVARIKPLLFNFNPPFKTEEFNRLPKWIQDKIVTSDEYLKLAGANTATPATDTTVTTGLNAGVQPTAGKKNVPF